MQTDRELLELAAKVSGIPGLKYWGGPCIPAAWIYDYEDAYTYKTWNPLMGDGDALRLAVQRRIKVRYNEALGQALAWDSLGNEYQVNVENCGRDECAATRHAIVRAAAEIGAHPKQHNDGGENG